MKIKRREYSNRIEYTLNDNFHREDGPALIWDTGKREWYLNGVYHRCDGPAIEYNNNGHKEWYHHGDRHRYNGPAVEWTNGTKEWFYHGLLHRTNGPAIEYDKNNVEYNQWYINGVDLTEEINQWFSDTNVNTDYKKWTDEEALQFKLRWG